MYMLYIVLVDLCVNTETLFSESEVVDYNVIGYPDSRLFRAISFVNF